MTVQVSIIFTCINMSYDVVVVLEQRNGPRFRQLHDHNNDDNDDEFCLLKPGFHYPSWRPKFTAWVDGWPVTITRQHVDGRAFPLAELTGLQHGPCWRVMETGHPSTRAVNSGRQLG